MSVRKQRRLVGLMVAGIPVVALVAVALALALGHREDTRVAADVPHAGLDFSIAVDTGGTAANDCNTTGGPTKCTLPLATSAFTLKLYLNGRGGVDYLGYDAYVTYTGVGSKDNASSAAWPDCSIPAAFYQPGVSARFTCVTGIGAPASTYTGQMATLGFNCAQGGGTITLVHGVSDTALDGGQHAEGEGTTESLTINCGAGPTPTNTAPGPTATPCGAPGPTCTPTATGTPTATRTPTRTSTPLPPKVLGDVDRNNVVNSLDALAVLQYEADLLSSLPNLESGDMNDDGAVDSIDALYILWIEAGLI